MEITAELVNNLRQKTGAGMMDCKRALQKTDGDVDKAVVVLREQGTIDASERTHRATSQGKVESYIHMDGKIGVLIEVNCETDFVAKNADFQAFCKEVAMQVAAANPKYLKKDDIPAEILDKERAIFRREAELLGKSEKVLDQIANGKASKQAASLCLLDQPYMRDPKLTIEKLRLELAAKTGENIVVKRFVRFQLGE